MKKIYLVCVIVIFSTTLFAQVPNGNFETVNSAGDIQHWSKTFLRVISFDSLGQSHSDSVVIDSNFYFASTEAHTGVLALEMRNAYDITVNEGIPGGVNLTLDTNYGGFNTQLIPVRFRPQQFSFFYKYLPAGADTALGLMVVYDSLFNEIGRAEVYIGAAAANYTQAIQAINYSAQDVAAYISVSFTTSTSAAHTTLGTRFLVDDVDVQMLGIGTLSLPVVKCYPEPAKDVLNFMLPAEIFQSIEYINIYGIDGHFIKTEYIDRNHSGILQLDIAKFCSGSYLIKFNMPNGQQSIGRFTKL